MGYQARMSAAPSSAGGSQRQDDSGEPRGQQKNPTARAAAPGAEG